ncbi:hypothetical protein [Leptospira haakeii]|uniref:Uncharacterized protein n=1 Tax=Leptospira haakeii TaxID=2023198 RepID=A0ABX4PG81_9LEPT|nr:hypothetical protein [Leptospira haakeii]PKA14386.1 hypothetical protein CH363_19000 [Leptospira haakeii]PKA19664.1 hypothetical protein CH377_11900 [Leptospira haakeii]
MPRKIALIAVSTLILSLFVLLVLPSSSKDTEAAHSHSGKSGFSERFSSLSNFLGLGSSSSNDEEGLIPASLLRNETPDNLYWVAVATPRDAAEMKAQNELREDWAALYGKIYSNKATRIEIDEYFTAQIKLHEDQLELLKIMEDRYPERLNDDSRRMILAGKELYAKKLKNVKDEYEKHINQK